MPGASHGADPGATVSNQCCLQPAGILAGKRRTAVELDGVRLIRIADGTDGQGDGYADGLVPAIILLEDMPVEVRRYGERTWGVWFGGELLCVAVYLRGARSVQTLVARLQDELRRARIGKPAMPMAFESDDQTGDQERRASA